MKRFHLFYILELRHLIRCFVAIVQFTSLNIKMSLADSMIFGCRAPSIMHFIVALSKIGPPDLNPLTYNIGELSASSPCTVTLEKNQLKQ